MQLDESVGDLGRRLLACDAAAAEEVFARFSRGLIRVAEQHLSRKLAGRLDGEDVVQSVFRTFFRRCAAGELRIDGSAELWRLLVQITLRKARAKGRFHTAEKRDASAEQATGDALGLLQALDRGPGPEEAAALVDQIEALLRGLPELYCHVLDRRLQGQGPTEIAAALGVSRMTIHRALNLLQQRLGASAEGPGAGPG
jgi:RNA polymerase sigma-70 factor (ECF subfamily)